MRKGLFIGAATALVTPFDEEGVNLTALRELLEFQIQGGINGVVVQGTTGEASTQSDYEKDSVIACAVEYVRGRIPVIAGVGGNDTAKVVKSAKRAAELGADAVLAVTPYYNKTSQQGLVKHYNMVGDATDLPVIVYNVPSRTGLNILPATYVQMGKHPNVCAIKEANADITQIIDTARMCPDMYLYSGNDDHVVPLMSMGGKGVITTVGNVTPREISEMCRLWFDGDIKGALAMQFKLNPLVKALFSDVNPIPVKTALRLMGYDVGALRMPLCDMNDSSLAALKDAMTAFGLEIKEAAI